MGPLALIARRSRAFHEGAVGSRANAETCGERRLICGDTPRRGKSTVPSRVRQSTTRAEPLYGLIERQPVLPNLTVDPEARLATFDY